ncbi:MAG: hypothetical protein M1833_002005 [Piccolia ochrophora]|nr:MAG: hypothetical protein M1833_002005 [Piccolia ochrophora]
MAPSIQYFNQSAPFWDFIASFEDKAFKDHAGADDASSTTARETPEKDNTEKQEPQEGEHPRHPRCGGPGAQFRGPPGGRRCGGPGRGGFRHHGGSPFGGPAFGMHPWAAFFDSQLGGAEKDNDAQDFKPTVDIFNTESAYHVHVSLPGAKKEDVGLNWNADKSELSIAGVVYRPGDEEFLKTLAMSERKVGVFERKVRLGNERHPAEVEGDSITAKMEDGVLRVEIPKVEKDYVDVKKVDIE